MLCLCGLYQGGLSQCWRSSRCVEEVAARPSRHGEAARSRVPLPCMLGLAHHFTASPALEAEAPAVAGSHLLPGAVAIPPDCSRRRRTARTATSAGWDG